MARDVLNYQSPTRRERAVWFSSGMGCTGYAAAAGILGLFLMIALARPARDRAGEAKHAAAKTDVATIYDAVAQFQADMGRLPTPAEGLDVLMEAPADGVGKWHGPYLRKLFKDPWGQPYVYQPPSDARGERVHILSFGPDRRPGGGDDISH